MFMPVSMADSAFAAGAPRTIRGYFAHRPVIGITEQRQIALRMWVRVKTRFWGQEVFIANPVEVVLAKSEQGRGVLGVIDGNSPKGVEEDAGVAWRHELLRELGYKR